ncbi:LOW QUALITY PROTEIN: uncharacterized protein [Bemisia tabaci]|uniref:LOW QUALITY PROTEIN: uncharacterized protein n=1 Tax=Bemisia tabaci TaxID=7038 RepID=UPI003B282CCA
MEELVVYKCDISTHLHLPDHAAVEAMQIVQNIRELAAEQPNARPSDVIRTGIGNVEEEVSVKLPEENHLKRMVTRRQNKERPRLPGPNTVNFEITAPYDRTRSDQLFLLYDSGREGANRTLIFSTSENLRILAASDTLLTDGTFKVVPRQFLQLYTLHGVILDTVFPFVFVLTTRKDEGTYADIYRQVKDIAAELDIHFSFQFLNTDFEAANINAVKEAFPNARIVGCLFHFSQSLWRQIVSRGLRARRFNRICDVVDHTYVRGKPARGRRRAVPPLFPPETWNVYNLVLADRIRTNNAVEGFHSKFNQIVGTHHANIWKLIDAFKKVQQDTERTLTQARGGHRRFKPPVSKKYTTNQAMMANIVRNYQHYKDTNSLKKYLRAYAYHLKLHTPRADPPDSDEEDSDDD